LPDYTSNESLDTLRLQKSDILPDFSYELAPLNLFVEKGISSRLELQSLGLQLEVNKTEQKLALANIMPNPAFTMGKSTSGNPPIGPKLTSVFFTIDQETPFTNLQQGSIYQYKATTKQLNFQIAAQRNMIYSDISGAYQNVQAAREKLRVYQEKLLRDSNEVARLAQRSYEVGQSDITAALLAQQANIQIRSDYLEAIQLYSSAFTELEQAVGRPLQ
ncbi:MAG: TolC family protein, partial [Candidatus Obscuribacterales bacterium]|nr:TolC family protein [Candidatus Obscuribacterales bacterium]